ncbi:hypothetical protein C0J52_27539, partial [Blattella germanica]
CAAEAADVFDEDVHSTKFLDCRIRQNPTLVLQAMVGGSTIGGTAFQKCEHGKMLWDGEGNLTSNCSMQFSDFNDSKPTLMVNSS